MSIKFRMANETFKKEWNEVVERSPSSEIFHLFEWGELIEKTYNIRVFRLIAEVNNRIVGVLPFVHFNNPIFGRKIVSLPFADIGGFCVVNEDYSVSAGLIQKLVRVAKELNADFVELRSLQENAKDLSGFGFTEGFQAFTYRLNTSIPYDDIWRKYNKKIRHNIRKMKKLGLEIKETQRKSDIHNYYQIYLKRMKDLGTPPAHLSYWKNMWDLFYPKGMMKLIFTVLDNRAIAGFVALMFKKKLYFVLNVSLKRFWKYYGLNELLFDWYIRYACENRYESVDFGRTRRGTGVQRFKEKGWGVERVPLCTYYLFLHGKMKNPLEIALSTDANVYAEVLRRLVPTSVTPALGHFIRRKIGDV